MTPRPTPRWVRIASIVTVLLTVVLLTLGGFVTTFRVGMADPVWPTEPWFLLGQDWQKLELGFLIEHTHRLAGWLTGVAAIVFTFGAWFVEPDRKLKVIGIVTLFGLVVSYGEFHRGMGKVWTEVQEKAKEQSKFDPKAKDATEKLVESHLIEQVTRWPTGQAAGTAAFAVAVLFFGIAAAAKRTPGGWVRLFANIGLVFVMVQGLLGGFRVFLNAIMGTNLAAIHGVFGQVTFAVFVAAMVMCKPRREGDAASVEDSSPLVRLAWWTLILLVVQLVWAAWVRHYGSAVAQRLHILTAFLITGLLVWLAAKILLNDRVRPIFRGIAIHLLVILGTQLLLGVESYMGKFVSHGPQAQVLPMDRQVKPSQAMMRTAHQLIGAGLLAAVAAAVVRFGRKPVGSREIPPATTTVS